MSAEFATPADIPSIMEIERTPGFEDVVGRWSQEQHAAEMAKDSVPYFVIREEATVKGCEPLNPEHTASLVVEGPTAEFDSTPLKDVDLPASAETFNGACEAKMTVKVPYAPRYTLGIAREGHGIATGDEPDPMWITTRGSSQKVTLVSQVVTTLR